MNKAEKTAKIQDLERQIRGIEKVVKLYPKKNEKNSLRRTASSACRIVRLLLTRAYINAQIDLIKSQPTSHTHHPHISHYTSSTQPHEC